jgi:amino acid permease
MITDTLIPNYDSSRRKSSAVAATFNLTATILGGGVLSLPLAFEKCGIVLASLLMITSLIITERSLYLLCLCARISGATTYGEVGKAAFGTKGEYSISIILFIYLMFVLVAFMILVQDIWCSIVEIITNKQEGDLNEDGVLLVVLILMSPFFVQRTLHALRFNCYVGFASVPILLLALWHHAVTEPISKPVLLWTSSIGDVLFAFPMINLSFLCVFNVLPVQAALIHPNRRRMQGVIDGALGSAFVVMVPFGIFGYMYAGEHTSGNILNNITASSDWRSGGLGQWLFFLGRLGCGITLTLAMPLMVLPCRESLFEILDVAVNGPYVVTPHEEIPLIPDAENAASNKLEILESTNPSTKQRRLDRNPWYRYLATFGIINTCYLISIRVPGVDVVWSLVGSSMAFMIAFILPSACYLKIQQSNRFVNDESRSWLWFSWILLVMAILAVIACTSQSIIRLL